MGGKLMYEHMWVETSSDQKRKTNDKFRNSEMEYLTLAKAPEILTNVKLAVLYINQF